jgi:hypothetical protein
MPLDLQSKWPCAQHCCAVLLEPCRRSRPGVRFHCSCVQHKATQLRQMATKAGGVGDRFRSPQKFRRRTGRMLRRSVRSAPGTWNWATQGTASAAILPSATIPQAASSVTHVLGVQLACALQPVLLNGSGTVGFNSFPSGIAEMEFADAPSFTRRFFP